MKSHTQSAYGSAVYNSRDISLKHYIDKDDPDWDNRLSAFAEHIRTRSKLDTADKLFLADLLTVIQQKWQTTSMELADSNARLKAAMRGLAECKADENYGC